jgi:hypothetical protein
MKFSIFEVDRFLQTLLRVEQWQERLAGAWQTNGRNLVWFGKYKEISQIIKDYFYYTVLPLIYFMVKVVRSHTHILHFFG